MDTTIHIRCPGSCGEFLQGWMDGSEKLISYAIDCHSLVTLQPEPSQDHHAVFRYRHPMAWAMACQVTRRMNVNQKALFPISLSLTSNLPRAKGMASSTADLAATAGAVAAWIGTQMTPREIAELCVELEPTDSVMYPDLVLMDPLTGEVSRQLGPHPNMWVLVLEGIEAVETKNFRKKNHAVRRKAGRREMERALALFLRGLETGDMEALGAACFISALENQIFYPFPGLEELNRLARKRGAYGINIAHSGTTAGVLFDPGLFNMEGFWSDWHRQPAASRFFPPRIHRMIPGGIDGNPETGGQTRTSGKERQDSWSGNSLSLDRKSKHRYNKGDG